jgi:hypothetical protein
MEVPKKTQLSSGKEKDGNIRSFGKGRWEGGACYAVVEGRQVGERDE